MPDVNPFEPWRPRRSPEDPAPPVPDSTTWRPSRDPEEDDPEPDWRDQLQSSRWGTGLRGDRLPKLGNPEMNPTSRFQSVLFWVGLGIVTFAILVIGYGIGFWSLATGT